MNIDNTSIIIEEDVKKGKNTVILVDYDNVYITLDRNYVKWDCENLKSDIIFKLRDLYSKDNVFNIKLFLDFCKISLTEEEFNLFKYDHISLNHVYSGKNASDVYLMLDIMKMLEHDNGIDKFIIVSSDSDMLPIINELKTRRKEVVVAYFDLNTEENYLSYLKKIADNCISIEKILNIEVYKENNTDKFLDNNEIKKILPLIDKIILDAYNEYLKKDNKGNILGVGTLNKGKLRDSLINHKVFVNADIKSGFAIDTLLSNNILYEYTKEGSKFPTLLINKEFLSQNSINFNVSIEESDFNY